MHDFRKKARMMVDCKTISAELREKLRNNIAASGRKYTLAIFKASGGDEQRDAQTETFLKQKRACGEAVGVTVREYVLNDYMGSQRMLEDYISAVVADKSAGINAALVQLPLPMLSMPEGERTVNVQAVLNKIPPEKDADVLNYISFGRFEAGRAGALVPPNVAAIQEVLRRHAPDLLDLTGKKVLIVGKGHVVGLQVERWTMQFKTAVLAVLDKGSNIGLYAKEADLIVSCVGSAGLIQKEMVREGVAVFDFGVSKENGSIRGDVDPSVAEKARLMTPVPGGVGPLAVTMLFQNVARINR